MNYILTAIIAIVAWQLVTTIVYFLSGEKEEAVAATGMGVWAGFIILANFAFRKIQLAISRKYNLYQFYGKNTNSNSYNGWCGNYFMTPKMAERFRVRVDDNTEHSIKLLRTGKEFKSTPPKKEIITEKSLETGCGCMTPAMLQKYFKEG